MSSFPICPSCLSGYRPPWRTGTCLAQCPVYSRCSASSTSSSARIFCPEGRTFAKRNTGASPGQVERGEFVRLPAQARHLGAFPDQALSGDPGTQPPWLDGAVGRAHPRLREQPVRASELASPQCVCTCVDKMQRASHRCVCVCVCVVCTWGRGRHTRPSPIPTYALSLPAARGAVI